MSNNTWHTLFLENCASHVEDEEVRGHLINIKTQIRKLVPTATNLLQPAEMLPNHKLKDAWLKRWDLYKMDCIKKGKWENGENNDVIGKSPNPGKTFFLNLTADLVRGQQYEL